MIRFCGHGALVHKIMQIKLRHTTSALEKGDDVGKSSVLSVTTRTRLLRTTIVVVEMAIVAVCADSFRLVQSRSDCELLTSQNCHGPYEGMCDCLTKGP